MISKHIKIGLLSATASLSLLASQATFAHEGNHDDEVKSNLTLSEVKESIYMISGDGGNVGVLVGSKETFVIDDKYAQNAEEIHQLVKSVGGTTPKYLVNTHFHGDHTGGNAYFGEKGSLILAHHNVRERLAQGYEVKAFGMQVEPVSGAALPTLTYAQNVELHLDNESIQLIHYPNAHTDTDTLVYFEQANVVHMGDLMFNGFFPFIDTDNGGSLKGVIAAMEASLALLDNNSIVIPGHGPLAKKADIVNTKKTLETAYSRLKSLKENGISLDKALAKKPLADIEKDWGGVIFSADQWISIVWKNL